MNKKTSDSIQQFKKLQDKATRDKQSKEILNNAIQVEKKASLRIIFLSAITTVTSAAILTAALSGNDNITELKNTAKDTGKDTTHIVLSYMKDGEEERFKFSFKDSHADEYPTKKYYIGNDVLDGYIVRSYSFLEDDMEKLSYDNDVNGAFDYGSFASNTSLRDKITDEALKAGFFEKTGLTELPDYLNPEKNTPDIAPKQRVNWMLYIDSDEKFDGLKRQYTDKDVPRQLEQVVHSLSLSDKEYCTKSRSRYEFNGITPRVEETCQNLDTMDKEQRSQLFEQFNAQNLFDTNNYKQKDAVISSKTTNNKTTYSVNWTPR